MAHVKTGTAEDLLDMEFKVLDKGFVRLVDYMGGDESIVRAARVSYGAGTKTTREDAALINYMIKNSHNTPVESVVLQFHIKCPLFIAAQWVRHRTASLNQQSARYSVMKDEFYQPLESEWRGQGTRNKQVGDGELPEGMGLLAEKLNKMSNKEAYADYQAMLDAGICREQARMVLPQNIYTEFYWKMDLHNLFHFLSLRLSPHAQAEIRAYAESIAHLARAVAPVAFDAFEEHVRYSVRLSRLESLAVAGHAPWNDPLFTEKQCQELRTKFDNATCYEASGSENVSE